MLRVTALAATALLLATPLIAQATGEKQQKAKVSKSAQEFVTKAANGGMFEVKLSELAVERARAQEVKNFARQMIEDHGKANQALKNAASKAGASVPQNLDNKHQARLDELRKSKDERFDNAYINSQAVAHDEAVKLFSGYSSSGDHEALRSFASNTLPTLQRHQSRIKELRTAKAARK